MIWGAVVFVVVLALVLVQDRWRIERRAGEPTVRELWRDPESRERLGRLGQ